MVSKVGMYRKTDKNLFLFSFGSGCELFHSSLVCAWLSLKVENYEYPEQQK